MFLYEAEAADVESVPHGSERLIEDERAAGALGIVAGDFELAGGVGPVRRAPSHLDRDMTKCGGGRVPALADGTPSPPLTTSHGQG